MTELTYGEQSAITIATTSAMRVVQMMVNAAPKSVQVNILSSIAMSCASSLGAWITSAHPEKLHAVRDRLLAAFDSGAAGESEALPPEETLREPTTGTLQ